MWAATTFSQRALPVERVIEKVFDYLSDETEQTPDFEELYETLYYFSEYPINLNDATKESLEALLFLTDEQVEELLYYRYRQGTMQTIYELQLVDYFDLFAIELLLPFVIVAPESAVAAKTDWKQLLRRSTHEIILRFDGTVEPKQGYAPISDEELAKSPNSRYVGDPFYASLRYQFKAKDRLQWGLTAEKDAGEQFWGDYNKGFDSYALYFQINRIWKFKTIVLGDYRASFGQGLVVNQGYLAPLAGNVTNVIVREAGLKKKSSTDEYNFFRGAGATLALGSWQLSAFYSIRKNDADTASSPDSFPSLKTDGLHRTTTDILRKQTVLQQTLGGNIAYRHEHFRVGLTAIHTRFDREYRPEPLPYRRYLFQGHEQTALGANYYFRIKHLVFAGETAVNHVGGVATLNSIQFAPVSAVSLALVQRYYSPRYDMLYARAFGRSSGINNESGLYLAADIQPARRWKISASGDIYRYPWLRYNVAAPSSGFDALLQCSYMPSRRVDMYLRGRYSLAPRNYNDALTATTQVGERQRATLRFLINYKLGDVQFRSVIEASGAQLPNDAPTTGLLLYQDLAYPLPWLDMTVSLRYAFFDAPSYDNRFYAYERDVPLTFAMPMLYGVGNRYYLMVRYRVVKGVTLYARFAQTIYADNRTAIGSGAELIEGNVKSDFRLFLQVKIPTVGRGRIL